MHWNAAADFDAVPANYSAYASKQTNTPVYTRANLSIYLNVCTCVFFFLHPVLAKKLQMLCSNLNR